MAYLMTVFYKNYLHSDFDIKRHTNIFILPVYLHLLPVFFCNHYARAAASDVTVTSTLNWSIGRTGVLRMFILCLSMFCTLHILHFIHCCVLMYVLNCIVLFIIIVCSEQHCSTLPETNFLSGTNKVYPSFFHKVIKSHINTVVLINFHVMFLIII